MMIKLAICLFLATQIHAGIIRSDDNTASFNSSDIGTAENVPYFNTDKLLEKIGVFNITCSDYDSFGGNHMSDLVVRMISPQLISKSVLIIARTEFRAALNFGPLPSIKNHNKTMPSEKELTSAPTLEGYYNLKETRSNPFFSLDSFLNAYLVDNNMPPAISFFDKKLPSIRILFRRKIQEILRSNEGKMNREEVDSWIQQLDMVYNKISEPIYTKGLKLECIK